MKRFVFRVRLYLHHWRRNGIRPKWPPRLIEAGKGKRRPCTHPLDQWVFDPWEYGGHRCKRCGEHFSNTSGAR